MQRRDITGQSAGKIWHRIPAPNEENGIIVSLEHSGKGIKTGRLRRFLHASFDKFKDKVLACDHLGGIYLLDLEKNRFSLIQNTGQSCTSIATGLKRKNEYLVGLADASIKCFNTENKELVGWMKGHESAVHSIAVHGSGRFAITTSRDTAQLWDLDTFERVRKLNVKSQVPIQKVFFLPMSNTILTCFTDDTIFGWESDSFNWKFKLETQNQPSINYKAYAVTKDSKTLICGGKSNLLHVYSLESYKLVQVVKLPSEVQAVKQLHFIRDKFDNGANKVLGVLCQDGIARYISIDSCRVLFELYLPDEGDKLSGVCCSEEGSDHVLGVSEGGKLVIFSIGALTNKINQPPGPLVRVVKDIWKKKTFNSSKSTKSNSTTNDLSQRSARRPLDGAMSTGRIISRKIKNSNVEEVNEEDKLPNGLNFPRLFRILLWFGEYPTQYRLFIWRSVLQIPENQAAFSSLVDKGTHLSFAAIQEKYPVKSGKLLRVMQRILSSLAHWSAIFSELDYLPLIVFPFIKLFRNNQLICFEMVATVLANWCQHWFEFFPNPPLNVLSIVENLLNHHDRKLLSHFVKCDVTTQIYVWPLLQTFMSEIFTRDEWLKLFDNVFSNHPSFLYYCIVAYSICCRSALLRTTQTEDFAYFYHHRNAIDVHAVIKEAYRMSECTPANIDPKNSTDPFQALPPGETYPIFNKYPKFIVDYQAQERERIRKDELDYLREKHIAQELHEQMEDRKMHEEGYYQRKEVLEMAEEQRRNLLAEEERKIVQQRKQLGAMKRELRIRELELLDKSRMRFVDHQQTMKTIEIKRLEEELQRKVRLREEESAAAVEDVEIKGLELEANKALLEQQMARQQVELEDELRIDLERRRKLEEYENRMHEKAVELRFHMDGNQELEEELAATELKENAVKHKTEVVSRLLYNDIDREKSLAQSLSRNINNLRSQKKINDHLKEIKTTKDREIAEARERLKFLESIRNEGDERRRCLIQDQDMEQCRTRIRESEKRMEEHAGRLRMEHHRLNDSLKDDTTRPKEIETMDEDDLTITSFSLNRNRGNLDETEHRLMEDVRNLRQRLVAQKSRR